MQTMRSRTIVLAGLAVALFGAVVVFVYARSLTTRAGGEAALSAYVATKDIPAGTRWDAAMRSVAKRPVPGSLRPASAIASFDQVTGGTSVRQIAKGEVITKPQFGKSAAAPGAGLQIPTGHNAVTMNMTPPKGVAGYVQAGDLVNIYVTIGDKGQASQTMTKLLLSNIQVLANHSAGTQERTGVATTGETLLTMALKPDAAEKVIFAKENGSLWFGLVHPGDKPASSGGRNAGNLLN